MVDPQGVKSYQDCDRSQSGLLNVQLPTQGVLTEGGNKQILTVKEGVKTPCQNRLYCPKKQMSYKKKIVVNPGDRTPEVSKTTLQTIIRMTLRDYKLINEE